MNLSRHRLLGILTILLFFAAGCTGADNTKIVDAPPPPPPTEAEKAVPRGKPPGYGSKPAYEKAMENAARR